MHTTSIACLLDFAAFIGFIAAGFGKVPAWVPGLLLSMGALTGCLPLR